MEEFYNNHYLTVDAEGRILDGWSDGPHPNRDTYGAVLLTDRGGYPFRLFDGGDENPILHTPDGIPLYAWQGNELVRRTEAEIEADREALPKPEPTPMEDIAALLVEQEYRITLLELGVI